MVDYCVWDFWILHYKHFVPAHVPLGFYFVLYRRVRGVAAHSIVCSHIYFFKTGKLDYNYT